MSYVGSQNDGIVHIRRSWQRESDPLVDTVSESRIDFQSVTRHDSDKSRSASAVQFPLRDTD